MIIHRLKGIILIICIIIFLLLTILSIVIYKDFITGKAIENFYTYTKAICNQTDYGWFCQDYIIYCNKNQIQNISPITGAVAKYPKSFNLSEKTKNLDNLCG